MFMHITIEIKDDVFFFIDIFRGMVLYYQLVFMKNESYFTWIAECCTLLGKDEMTAAEAVAEFKETYPNGYPKEIEHKYL